MIGSMVSHFSAARSTKGGASMYVGDFSQLSCVPSSFCNVCAALTFQLLFFPEADEAAQVSAQESSADKLDG